MTHTLVAAFDTLAEAQAAKSQLLAQNVPQGDIELSSSELHASTASDATTVHSDHDNAFLHKVSQFFASLFGADEDDRQKPHRYATAYPEAYRRGATVLTVTAATDVQAELVEEILERNGAIDIDERAAAWSNEEAGSTHVAGTHLGTDRAEVVDRADDLAGRTSIPVIEENLRVGKRELNTGRVRVVSRISERPVEETVSLHEEHAHIERHPVNRPATAGELNSFKEGSIEIQETAEELVVEKSARVVEEVTVGKQSSDHKETVRDTVRRTDVDVQTEPGSVTQHETLVKNQNDPLKNR